MPEQRPNVLFVMTDQQRFDTIRSLGNTDIRTPNIDRLVQRGVSFTNAYSTCPVCVPARYTMRTGSEPTRTGLFANEDIPEIHQRIRERCGGYLAETMQGLGYRTFGVGKFHTQPWDANVGFEVQLHSEEFYETAAQRQGDAYASWISKNHPEFDWIEALMGERTEMYYAPQMSPLPAEATVEAWTADRAVELIQDSDARPYFGFVSFIGPHPPLAPPLPFNRMYDPDRMTDPVKGDVAVDHLDQQIPSMNYGVFAEDISDSSARILKARYYGEITYIDQCLGRILDAVEEDANADNTLICFYSDHGDHMGDHHAWQKESFFEASTRIPFLLSWPRKLAGSSRSNELVCLTDLFGIATSAAGKPEIRQGADVLGSLTNNVQGRKRLFGYHGRPGTNKFKVMVREGSYKYIWMANGGNELLFDLAADPNEKQPLQKKHPHIVEELRNEISNLLKEEGAVEAFDGEDLKKFVYETWDLQRIYQFDHSRGVTGFPGDPAELINQKI